MKMPIIHANADFSGNYESSNVFCPILWCCNTFASQMIEISTIHQPILFQLFCLLTLSLCT